MLIKGGKFIWFNPANGVTYSEMLEDASDSKVSAAEARAATALSITSATLRLKGAGRDGDPRRGNKHY